MDLIQLIRDKMMREHLMFVYRGVVTNENSVPLLMLLEKEMENSEFGFVGRKRLFMFVLESLQNVSRHSDGKETANMSIVVYSKTDNGYSVSTGNVISSNNIPDLKKRLDEINSLNVDEIRAVYRQMLSHTEFSSKGGAGLGLIEMAKKTGNRLDYDFLQLDDDKSYFILNKTVDAEGMGYHTNENNSHFKGEAVAQLEEIMADNNIYMIWSGHITSDISKEVISFTETKLSEDEVGSSIKRKVFSVLVETIENVAKYSLGREAENNYGMPIAMLKVKDGIYSVTTGNLVKNEDVANLKGKIDNVNSFDRQGLKELYRQSLSGQTNETDRTGNMGLIDMARKSGSKLKYCFDKVNDVYSYYMVTVNIEE